MSSSRRVLRPLVLFLATVLAVPLTALLAAAPAHAAAFTAEGLVYDGLGDPVAGVTVTALESPSYTGGSQTATTQADGGYALTLTAGTYKLRYAKAGSQTTFYGGGTGVPVVVDGSGQITVGGEPVEDNLLDDITLESTAVHAVTGVVRNASSTALSGITVEAFRSGEETDPVDTTTTNGTGAFQLDVPTGVYQVRFTDESGTYLTAWYGDDDRTEVTVTGPATLDDVTLAKPSASQKFPIAGTVVDANGDPVAGVAVSVDHVGASTDSGTDTTTAEGAYSVSVLPGTYQVGFVRTGWVSTKYGSLASPATVTVAANGTLSVAPAEELEGNRLGDLTLASDPFSKPGTVKAATGGAGLAGISVRAFPFESTDPSDVVTSTTSAAGGTYTLGLRVGHYDLQFVDEANDGTTYTTTTLADVAVGQDGALVVGGTPVAALPDVAMALSSADTRHPVLGSVVDATGAEIDGVGVYGINQAGDDGDDGGETTTGADGPLGDHGRYRLMLKPGSYEIYFDGGTHFADTRYVGAGTSPALVTVQLNGTVLVNGVEAVGGELGSTELTGTTKYTVNGSVREGSTPLGGITVTAYAESDPTVPVATTTSSPFDGSWTFQGSNGLLVGTYVFAMSGSSGGTTYDRTWFGGATPKVVTVAQDGYTVVDGSTVTELPPVQMTRSSADTPHPVSGEVTDVNGDPLTGVTVTPTGGPSTATATTSLDGAYTLQLKPGTYQLGYAKGGFTGASYPSSVTVALDGSVTAGSTPVTEGLDPVELAQTTGTTSISGRVLSGGTPISGITVELFPEGDLSGAALASTTTSGTGTWSLTAVRIGSYTVRFTDKVVDANTYVQTFYGGATLATSTPVKVGQSDVVSVLDVPKAGGDLGDTSMSKAADTTTYPVSGDVTDANGDPVAGVVVTPSVGPTTTTATTDAEGHYELQLRAGTYRLGFTKSGFTASTYPGSGEPATDVVVASGGSGLELDGVTLEQATGTTTLSGFVSTPLPGGGTTGVSGITVEVFPEGDLTAESRVATTTTTNGSWSIAGIRIGTYTIRLTDNVPAAPTYVQKLVGPVKVGQGTSNNVFLGDTLKPGGDLGAEVMQQADANTLFDVSGAVVDANFDGIEGATVSAVAKSGGANATATTDPDGAYTLELKAGTYEISAVKAGAFAQAYVLNAEGTRAQVVVASNGALSITDDGPVTEGMLDLTLASTVKYALGGTVVNTGAAPIQGITVRALVDGTPSGVAATTAANGTFTLQLPVGTYTIEFVDTVPAAPSYITTSFGGTTPKQVKVSANGVSPITDADTGEPIAGAGTVTMEAASADTTYDVKGLVLDEAYEPLDGATVLVLPVNATSDSQAVATGTTGADTDSGEEHGYYRIPVRAGKYVLKYKAAGHMTTYLTSFDTGKPAVVTVAASGITSPGFEFVGNQIEDVQLLLPAPKMLTAPKLSGKIAVGEKITTTVGKWDPNIEQYADWKDYVTIEWFIDGRPADDYSSGYYYQNYKIPAEAAGKKLSYRITIEDANPDGPFLSPIVFTSKPVLVPKATPKLTASYKKGKLTVVVKVAGITKPLGTITVIDGKKKIGTIKLTAKSKGKAVLKLKKLKPGKHKLTISYSGDTTVNPAKTKLKIKV